MSSAPQPRKTFKTSDSLNRQLNTYALVASAAGVSMLALAGASEAKVVYTKTHQVTHTGFPLYIDLNHDGIKDFVPQSVQCARERKLCRWQRRSRQHSDRSCGLAELDKFCPECGLQHGELVPSVTSFADDQARFDILVRTGSQRLSAFMRAFLLATSAGWRARLMLPTGVLSGVECPVTSKYIASASSGWSCDFDKSVSRASVWKGASASFHSILAFSIQKLASWRLPQYVIRR